MLTLSERFVIATASVRCVVTGEGIPDRGNSLFLDALSYPIQAREQQ